MAIVAYAVPILPGQSDAAGRFEEDLDAAGMRERYEELNRHATVRSHHEWVEPLPTGDLLVVVFETDDPMALARSFTDGDAYDDWWRARVRRIHGFDPVAGGVTPRQTWTWER